MPCHAMLTTVVVHVVQRVLRLAHVACRMSLVACRTAPAAVTGEEQTPTSAPNCRLVSLILDAFPLSTPSPPSLIFSFY